jgi:hypothetical protein
MRTLTNCNGISLVKEVTPSGSVIGANNTAQAFHDDPPKALHHHLEEAGDDPSRVTDQ